MPTTAPSPAERRGGGQFLSQGSTASLTAASLSGNAGQGVLATDSGTAAALNSGNAVTNTLGIGLNAQNGASISCNGPATLGGNTGGNVFGSVSGCQ